MIQRAKSILFLGALACAAALLIVSLPKTAHALAAALVQITNTADNPAVTQDVSMRATSIVLLRCEFFGTFNCYGMAGGIPYVIPAGKSLVVTAVDIYAPKQNYVALLGPLPGKLGDFIYIEYPAISGQLHYAYPSGIVWPPGASPTFDAGSQDTAVYLSGYLTSN